MKRIGVVDLLKEEAEKKVILEIMLERYNPGRSMSFYCLVSALISAKSLKRVINQIENSEGDKPRLLKSLIQELADQEGVNLRLRK